MSYFNRFVTSRLRKEFKDFSLAHEPGYYDKIADFYINTINFEGSYFLDYGCGDGELSFLIRSRVDCAGLGVDLSPVAIERAQSRPSPGSLQFEVMDLALDEYDGVQPEIIFSHSVFQYIQEPEKILRKFYKILPGGGNLILSVPSLKPHHPINLLQWVQFLLLPDFLKKLYPKLMRLYCQLKLLVCEDQEKKEEIRNFLKEEVLNSKSRYLAIPPTHLMKEEQWKLLLEEIGFNYVSSRKVPTLNKNNPHFAILARKPQDPGSTACRPCSM